MAKIELHPITKELLTAIDGAFAVSPFASTIMVNASEAEDEFGLDRIKIENNYVWITATVDRPKKLVYSYGCMKYAPGTQNVKLMRFGGEIVLDFNKLEMKADGNMFVDVFTRMMKQYNAIASLMKKEEETAESSLASCGPTMAVTGRPGQSLSSTFVKTSL